MLKGLQTGFGDPIGADLNQALAARGVQLVRVTCGADPSINEQIVGEARDAGLLPYVIVARPEHIACVPHEAWAVELANEPDISSNPAGPGPIPIAQYQQWVQAAVEQADARTLPLFVGCVSNIHKNALAYLKAALAFAPAHVGASWHRYPDVTRGILHPRSGYPSLEAEIAAVKQVVGARRWGCSEFGFHTAPQHSGAWFWRVDWRWTDAQVAIAIKQYFGVLAAAGVEFAVVYQINDGSEVNGQNFGMRTSRLTGGGVEHWKPQIEAFR